MNVDGRAGPIPFSVNIKNEKANQYVQKMKQDNKQMTEYDFMIHVLSNYGENQIIDFLRKDSESPITMGDIIIDEEGVKKPRETVLTAKDDLMTEMSLDYIFQIIPGHSEGSEHARLDATAQVEHFFIQDKPFTQMSDHYAVRLNFKISYKQDKYEEKKIDKEIEEEIIQEEIEEGIEETDFNSGEKPIPSDSQS